MGRTDLLGGEVASEPRDFHHGASPLVMELEPTGRARTVMSYEYEATYPDGRKALLWSHPEALDAPATYAAVRRQAIEEVGTWRDVILTREEWAHVASYMRESGDPALADGLEAALASLPAGIGALGAISWNEAMTVWQVCHRLGIPL